MVFDIVGVIKFYIIMVHLGIRKCTIIMQKWGVSYFVRPP